MKHQHCPIQFCFISFLVGTLALQIPFLSFRPLWYCYKMVKSLNINQIFISINKRFIDFKMNLINFLLKGYFTLIKFKSVCYGQLCQSNIIIQLSLVGIEQSSEFSLPILFKDNIPLWLINKLVSKSQRPFTSTFL